MTLAILSDIHGNLEAVEAVLADLAQLGGRDYPLVCLGDMVGYGADPEAVVQTVRRAGAACVKGNHEVGVCHPDTRNRFNPQAWEAVRWTASKLSPESLRWLAGLPLSLSLNGCRFVHGLPPDDVDTYLFQASTRRVHDAMNALSEDICFVGHTHLLRLVTMTPNGAEDGLALTNLGEGVRRLAPGLRHLVNAGAVGQPRDGDPKAKYCLYDPDSRELAVRFVPYDARTAARKILAAGQPAVYAERIDPGIGLKW